jgi:hypothetical protein
VRSYCGCFGVARADAAAFSDEKLEVKDDMPEPSSLGRLWIGVEKR